MNKIITINRTFGSGGREIGLRLAEELGVPFYDKDYGLLLMYATYAIDETCPTAATDGKRILFGPTFLENLSDSELDYVMMHEILHIVLQHCFRQGERERERFNIACNIVVNSNLLLEANGNPSAITLKKYGPGRHFDDSPFFLLDFNDKDFQVKDVLFLIDTSGSMSDKMVTAAYSELKGAIDQFNGKLQEWLGFFDGAIIPPKLFSEQEELE